MRQPRIFVVWAISALALAWMTPTAEAQDVEVPVEAPPAEVPPAEGDGSAWLAYTVHRTVDEGTGAYVGYSDALRAAGRYDVTRAPDALTIHAVYRWTYRGEQCDEGAEDREVHVALPSRTYVGRTDLDDYDARTEPLATWVWVPTDLVVGAHARILERDFTVIDVAAFPTVGGEVQAIHLRAEGADRRQDAYGSFATRFVDEYWFDATTGYFLESRYVEHDDGAFEGARAGFTWTETVRVSGASYLSGTSDEVEAVAPCRAPASRGGRGGGSSEPATAADAGFLAVFLGSSFCVVVGTLIAFASTLGLLVWFLTRRKPTRIDGHATKVRSLSAMRELDLVPTAESPHFAAFLRHFVDHALRAGERVAVLDLDDGRCVGLAIGDREGRVSSIFAKHGDACELLRAHLGATEIFTEHRHESLPSVEAAAQQARAPKLPLAYNVLETYEILELASPTAQPYDAAVVSRMTEADLPAVAALSQEVHGLRGERWTAAALEVGDLGFVAKLDGAVVGYAFATLVGDQARLYGNTVATAHRSKGLGRELARARLSALAALGAARVVTEVATWNVASLEVIRGLGFAKVGTMWVETSSPVRVERKLVRR